MPRIKIGVQVQPQHADYEGMRRAWVEAEEMGCDTIFNWDHFFPLYGEPDGKHYEAIALLGALAEATEKAQIGSLVICNSYRNPELLAHAHVTVDHVSGGRAILGIGAGWFQRDYDEYGYEFGTKGSRLRELGKALPRIKDRVAKLNPGPKGDLPILIGGGGPKVTLKLVARYGDAWHSFGDLETYKQKDEILRQHCDDVGRDPDEIERTWGARNLDDSQRDAFVEAGVTHFILGVGGDGQGYDLTELRDLVRWRDERE